MVTWATGFIRTHKMDAKTGVAVSTHIRGATFLQMSVPFIMQTGKPTTARFVGGALAKSIADAASSNPTLGAKRDSAEGAQP